MDIGIREFAFFRVPPFDALIEGWVFEGGGEEGLRGGIAFGADDGQVERGAREFEFGEEDAGDREACGDRCGGEIAHGGLADGFEFGVASVIEELVGDASDGDVFVALRMGLVGFVGGGDGGDEAGGRGCLGVGVCTRA